MRALFFSAFCVFLVSPSNGQSSSIVISQIYGGGGNAGSTLRNDYIELFNRGIEAVNIAGWTVQYASANGSSWDRTTLSGTIAPSQYYLIQLAQGNSGTVALPPSDAIGGVNLSATSGKVALVSDSRALSGASPAASTIVDFVGYGSANASEGSTANELSNTTAAIRRSNGCMDTNDNRADFTTGSPNPRNSRSPLNPCARPAGPLITEAGITNAASFLNGPVAPGEMITIFGSGFGPSSLATLELTADGRYVTKALASTRVLFDGVAAPMIYAVANQITAVVPFSVTGRESTTVQVEYNGQLSNRVVVPVAPTAPGVFTLDSSGQGAILNQDWRVNGVSAPAASGSVVTIFATGAGQTIPAGDDGFVIGTELPRPAAPVRVSIAGVEAEVLYAGAAPGLVSGVLQLNVRVPSDLPSGQVALLVSIGEATSQANVTIAVGAGGQSSSPDGTGAEIEEKLVDLKSNPAPAPLPELPHDQAPIPADWLALVSWNIQTGGTSPTSTNNRPRMVATALGTLFSGTYQLLAAQEIPNSEAADYLRTLLPGGSSTWQASFFDTSDSMDNGFWYRRSITLRDSFPLYAHSDGSGRLMNDSSKAVHPPQVAQFEAGDFDFTLITLHLTFADGNTSESVRELREVLEYVDWYFSQPDHDPDVIICGDFNIPSRLSGQTGRGGILLDEIFEQDIRFQIGERRFVTTVHEGTSRGPASGGGLPASNYDHCVLSADTMEEFIQARRVSTGILTDHAQDPEERLTSDHFPIVGFFRTRGEGIKLDLRKRIRPTEQ